jgi:hypothetical protein
MTRRSAGVVVVVLLSAGLAACSSGGGASPTANGNPGSPGAGGGTGITYTAQITFTGLPPIQGSFTDSSSASSATSCTDYASNGMKPLSGWFGPNPNGSTVGGQPVTFSLSIDLSTFHGPGTYKGNSFMGLKIGPDLYTGGANSITVNADGSGSASFSGAQGPGTSQVEAGTIMWTCSG